ncbi:hypothetical protein [Brevibacillus laterosporus]|uniref:hypothetical protein n=1 Tax=Brevibacillus laterosporus TaxID=1465 RepID=UPI000E6D2267|nr:hypothetical protein [Brevibacillus laterosporus]AYB38541.1 hypothetical protein D5F52_09865 [Brevibacillus laterosporus]MBM7110722.1 hypothetical protein [Brevibacillus laterosporus]
MKKVIFSLLTLALVTSISSSALATEKIEATEIAEATEATGIAEATEINALAAIFYDREPNDTWQQANAYMIGGQINGEVGPDDNIDWYTFTPTRSGEVSFVFAYALGEEGNAFRLVVSEKGEEGQHPIDKKSTFHPGEALEIYVKKGKKYYVRVEAWERDNNGKHDYNIYTEYIN